MKATDWWEPRLVRWPRLRCGNGHWAVSWWSRQNTRYANDRANWACLCSECQNAEDEHWSDMWDEYYRGCM